MTSMTAKLTKDDLEQISAYLADRYPVLKGPHGRQSTRDIEIDIRERIVRLEERGIRVEEELKTQRELIREIIGNMDKRFEQTDKRFEQIDKRFEQTDKRFEQIDKRFEQIDKRFEQIDKRFAELREDMNSRFKMMMAFMGAGFTIATTVIAVVTAVVK